ncbi:response regulator transcription factor [Oscillochloris sp. ZM17-4]|uniref:ANTAR domain-containing response regulator n=1 Tax=Oscillochloris sp. ZM17-4 TaxID=2866714 RepID=UPI001C72DD8E|nr:response regulator transcription factor [Oscillochloris sp. ZM17-4]MBX0328472.1 response regulator transcription factor [Oscillochloris sp. ZM17-4]
MERGVRVLLADNNDALRRMRRAALEALALDVVGEAGEGCAAVQATRRLAPDVVLLDYHMPLMDGMDAARLIRRDPCAPAIIMLAGRVTPALAASAAACGVFALLEKGRPLSDLHAAIMAACGLIGLERAA